FRIRTRTSDPSEQRSVKYGREILYHFSLPAAESHSIYSLHITPDHQFAVASSIYSNRITILDVQQKRVLRHIHVDDGAVRGSTLNSDGTKLYYSYGYPARVIEVDFPSGLNPQTVFTSPITFTAGIISFEISP